MGAAGATGATEVAGMAGTARTMVVAGATRAAASDSAAAAAAAAVACLFQSGCRSERAGHEGCRAASQVLTTSSPALFPEARAAAAARARAIARRRVRRGSSRLTSGARPLRQCSAKSCCVEMASGPSRVKLRSSQAGSAGLLRKKYSVARLRPPHQSSRPSATTILRWLRMFRRPARGRSISGMNQRTPTPLARSSRSWLREACQLPNVSSNSRTRTPAAARSSSSCPIRRAASA